jgi:hypothetical protein
MTLSGFETTMKPDRTLNAKIAQVDTKTTILMAITLRLLTKEAKKTHTTELTTPRKRTVDSAPKKTRIGSTNKHAQLAPARSAR